jgi:hypothetical protein
MEEDKAAAGEGTVLLRKLHPAQKIQVARLTPQLIKNWIDA